MTTGDEDADDTGIALIAVLRGRLAAARRADRGEPAQRQDHVDAAFALALALARDHHHAEASDVVSALAALAPDPRGYAVLLRRRLARELWQREDRDAAIEELRVAREHAREHTLDSEAEVAIELAVLLLAHGTEAAARQELTASAAVIEGCAELAPELAAAHARALAMLSHGTEALDHARRWLEHASEAVDAEQVAQATSFVAERLFDAGELSEARKLLVQRPPTHSDSRRDRALFDAIRRGLGEHVADPPDEPDPHAELPPRLRNYFTRPGNVARAVIDGALPDERVAREWAQGTVRTVADLESQTLFGPTRSYWCACGWFRGREYSGLVCHRCGVHVVPASSRRTRVGLIELAAPVIHPWYAPAASVLLGIATTEVLALPAAELRSRLLAIDLAALTDRAKHDIVTAAKARLADEAGRRLALVDAFRHAHAVTRTTPASLVLDVVLVPPPDADLGVDRARVRDAYVQLLETRSADRVEAVFAALAGR